MQNQTNRDILTILSENKVLTHVLMWVLFALFFLLGFSGVQPLEKSMLLVFSILGFSLPAVYLHFYLVEKLLRQKKYLFYIFSIIVILVLYGRLINFAIEEWIFANEEGTYVVGEFILAVFLIMASGLHYFVAGLQAKSQLAESEAQKTKAELNSLKMQLNPHFLFNSLNNIYGLMEDDSSSAQALLKLSSLLRYMLDSSDKSHVSLKEEVDFIEDYIAMEQLRLNNCRINVTKEGSFSEYEVTPFLMIPFVENAFKHGNLNGPKCYINVVIKLLFGELNFEIYNLKNENSKQGHQIGINNARKRLELLDKAYSLDVIEKDKEFGIKLKLKL